MMAWMLRAGEHLFSTTSLDLAREEHDDKSPSQTGQTV